MYFIQKLTIISEWKLNLFRILHHKVASDLKYLYNLIIFHERGLTLVKPMTLFIIFHQEEEFDYTVHLIK